MKIGRIAGQFAKPRSSPTERVGDVEMPVVPRPHRQRRRANRSGAHPRPSRMLRGYHHSAATLNLVRAFTKGGFADLSQVHSWNQEFVATSAEGRRYEAIAAEIDRALAFMAACGIDLAATPPIHQVDFFTSHEALLLDYEEALTRRDSLTGDWYDCSAHMSGSASAPVQLDGAHVEFFSGVKQPDRRQARSDATTLKRRSTLCERLNPERIPGRLTLIARLGVENVTTPAADRARGHRGRPPGGLGVRPDARQHLRLRGGRKTRHFDDVLGEIQGFFAVHHAEGTWPGGVHVELTGDDVTECLGGSRTSSRSSCRSLHDDV